MPRSTPPTASAGPTASAPRSRAPTLGDEPLEEAFRSCDLALEVDPELSDAHTLRAAIHWAQADRKLRYGKDPQADLAGAVAEAQKAIALNPRDARAFNYLSVAHRLLASW